MIFVTMEENPIQLIDKAKKGDTEAFGRLYEMYYAPVYRYVYLRTRSKQSSEDIAQTVFLKMYSSIEKFEHKKDSPLPFLFTIARNTMLDSFRKESHSAAEDDETLSEKIDERSHYDFSGEKESKNLAEIAVSILEGEQKDAIILKFLGGMPNSEIAKVLGKSEEMVRQLQSRGIKKIREHFKEKGIFE